MNLKTITKSEEETITLGKEFSEILNSGDVVELIGNLGTGKTHFVKGLAEGMNFTKKVASPTFTIINEYNGGKLPVYHFDCYRINNLVELQEIGFEEYIYGSGVCVFEWGEKVEDLLPLPRFVCEFKHLNKPNEREIEIKQVEKK